MYDTNSSYLQAELDYRASRIRSGISGRRQPDAFPGYAAPPRQSTRANP